MVFNNQEYNWIKLFKSSDLVNICQKNLLMLFKYGLMIVKQMSLKIEELSW
jgi:hypothetical protein